MRELFRVIGVHMLGEGGESRVMRLGQRADQCSGGLTCRRATGLIGGPALVVRQQLFAMVLIKCATAGEFECGLLGGNLRINLGIGMAIARFFRFDPVGFVGVIAAMLAQRRHGQLQLDL